MRLLKVFIISIGLLVCREADAVRLLCNIAEYDYGWSYPTTVCNTDLGTVEDLRFVPIRAVASDDTYYSLQAEQELPRNEDGSINEDGQCHFIQRIVRLVGHPVLPERLDWETVYEEELFYDLRPDSAGNMINCHPGGAYPGYPFQDLEVRKIEGTDVDRLYVSLACGACGTKSIYYVDSVGADDKTLYYELPDAIGVASCGGMLSNFWAGDFFFDDANNLYISSGNHIPAAVFRISGAGLDAVTGSPEQIYERSGSIMDFVMDGPSKIYFLGDRSLPYIYSADLASGTEELVFNDPTFAAGERVWDIVTLLPPSPEISFPSSSVRLPYRLPIEETTAPYVKMEWPPYPDLIVQDIDIGDPDFTKDGKKARLPIRVTIKNGGLDVQRMFNITLAAAIGSGAKLKPVPFISPGKSHQAYGLLKGLDMMKEISLVGFVDLEQGKDTSLLGQEVTIEARVDSCLGEKAPADFCRIKETNEENNTKSTRFKLIK